jgi:putative glutamine amidotransferase
MSVHIAIPEPTSSDRAYNERSLPLYMAALQAAGAIPVVVPLDQEPDRLAKQLAGVQGVLLPGSGFDVDPHKYGEEPIPECQKPDPARAAVDELLLRDAFALRKPVLGICQGAQVLNVWRGGKLVQDLKTAVNHRPGRDVVEAHAVQITPGSRLARFLPLGEGPEIQVNSSHHQAIREIGGGLLVSAVSPVDGVIEAVELDAPEHFVLAVQWHPERTFMQNAVSSAIFAAFVKAVEAWKPSEIKGLEQSGESSPAGPESAGRL